MILIYFIMQLRLWTPKVTVTNTGLGFTPLLSQPVNKAFNREKVWVSMSLCYSSTATRTQNLDNVAKAFLAISLWKKLTEVNVVLQVYNNTNIVKADQEILNLIKKKEIYVILSSKETPSECICDCALQASIERTLLHQQPVIANYLQDDDIVILADVNSFLSKPHL